MGLVLMLQTSAISSPHDLPPAECFGSFDSLFLPDRFGPFQEISEDAMDLEHPYGFEMQDFPELYLLDLSGLPRKSVEQHSSEVLKPTASVQSNYLASREKLDENCDVTTIDASSTIDRANQTYRGLYCRDYLDLANHSLEDFEPIADSLPMKAEITTEAHNAEMPNSSELIDSDSITSTNKTLGPEYFQPLFVIYRLDGKEFVVPSGHARHWNYVPEFGPQTISNDSQKESEDLNVAVNQFRLALADGLEKAANGLVELANRLRAEASASTSISHTATNCDQSGLK